MRRDATPEERLTKIRDLVAQWKQNRVFSETAIRAIGNVAGEEPEPDRDGQDVFERGMSLKYPVESR
jgi:hypothetical protein